MSLGMITLNISFVIYLIWLVPQIILNFQRKSTSGLSLMMHHILLGGYLCDLLYGFGNALQWQYRTVTIIGLISLTIQHYQFWRYGFKNEIQKKQYKILTACFTIFLIYMFIGLKFNIISSLTYTSAGMLSQLCWLSYAAPQILKNYHSQSTTGLSAFFVIFAISLNICDAISAWSLNWPIPSKIGPLCALFLHILLFLQYYRYQQTRTAFS